MMKNVILQKPSQSFNTKLTVNHVPFHEVILRITQAYNNVSLIASRKGIVDRHRVIVRMTPLEQRRDHRSASRNRKRNRRIEFAGIEIDSLLKDSDERAMLTEKSDIFDSRLTFPVLLTRKLIHLQRSFSLVQCRLRS